MKAVEVLKWKKISHRHTDVAHEGGGSVEKTKALHLQHFFVQLFYDYVCIGEIICKTSNIPTLRL